MTKQEQEVRANSSMSAFTLYIDDFTKLKTLLKLKALGLDTKKGSMAATIRVLLNYFADDKFDEIIQTDTIKAEYLFTTKKNKRSSL